MDDLTAALRHALAAAGPSWQHQPSILRRRLEQHLAHEAVQHRARIHQLVIAAEEKVPGRLAQRGNEASSRHELAGALAATRGWTDEAAAWAVDTWAAALGLIDDAPATTLPEAATALPDTATTLPDTATTLPDTATTLPDPARWQEPTELPDPVVAPTELPDAT